VGIDICRGMFDSRGCPIRRWGWRWRSSLFKGNQPDAGKSPSCSLLRFAIFLQHMCQQNTLVIAACQKHPRLLTTNLARQSLVNADQTSMDPFPSAHGLPRDQCNKESSEERVHTRRYGEGASDRGQVFLRLTIILWYMSKKKKIVVRREYKKYTGTVSLKIQGYF
jgi:hypothetical protein